MIPDRARLEAVTSGGVALYDVSHLVRQHPRKRYRRRPVSRISRLYVHHSGRLGARGFAGAYNSVRYSVEQRDWPGAPYHFWLPYNPVHDDEGRLVWLRLQPDAVRCYHTGGPANTHGLGLALQGNTTARPMSPSQVELLESAIPWVHEQHGLSLPDGLGWHAIAGRWGGKPKPSCPGQNAEQWLRAYVAA